MSKSHQTKVFSFKDFVRFAYRAFEMKVRDLMMIADRKWVLVSIGFVLFLVMGCAPGQSEDLVATSPSPPTKCDDSAIADRVAAHWDRRGGNNCAIHHPNCSAHYDADRRRHPDTAGG
jgi:hypothetical protein